MGRRWHALAAVSAVIGVMTGCGGGGSASSALGRLEILAAASLTEVFADLARTFEATHPDVRVVLSFGPSSALARRIEAGGRADVFVPADDTVMRPLLDAGLVAEPRVVARNRLAIVVGKGNPRHISGLSDLARPGMTVLLCAPEVPCGRLASAALREAGVAARPASLERDVKAVVTKVRFGEADAGIVYATDVRAADGEVDGVSFRSGIEAVYPASVTKAAANRQAAHGWIDLLTSEAGRRALARHGFLLP